MERKNTCLVGACLDGPKGKKRKKNPKQPDEEFY
jgi:hypothetical protein